MPVPSERQCTSDGTAYVPAAQRVALASLAAAERLRRLDDETEHPFTADLPTTDVAALEEELAYLYEAFSAIPDGFDHEHPDNPSSYAETMASLHA